MPRLGRVALACGVVLSWVTGIAPPPAAAGTAVPPGYTVASSVSPGAGVVHVHLTRANPPVSVHVAHISPGAPVSLRAVLSNERVAGPAPLLETTSSMCARVHCLLAVNGDFGVGQPLGGLVSDGRLLRSPSDTHHQLSVTDAGALEATSFEWSGKLLPTDLQPVTIGGVNVPRRPGQVVLYTPAFGPSTATAAGTALLLRFVEPAEPPPLGRTALVELVSLADAPGDTPIPAGGAVLSADGAGAEALRGLWDRVGRGSAAPRALLRLDTTPDVVESVGGSPILVKDGQRWFTDPGDDFTRGRHPRTLVGWGAAGDVFLVTVDGRQPGHSVGMSLFEAADLLLALGATEGINLDGGGSTTFVDRGAVVNQPSDVAVRRDGREIVRHAPQPGDTVVGHRERPVSSGLAVVTSNEVAVPPVDPLAGPSLGLPQALALPAPAAADPGSIPAAGLPALVSRRAPEPRAPVVALAVAGNVLVAGGVGAALVNRRRRRSEQRI